MEGGRSLSSVFEHVGGPEDRGERVGEKIVKKRQEGETYRGLLR